MRQAPLCCCQFKLARRGRGLTLVCRCMPWGQRVCLQDGVVLRCAMVCEKATLRSGCFVGPGAIISYECVVDAKHEVPPHTRISLCKQQHAAVRPMGGEGRGSPCMHAGGQAWRTGHCILPWRLMQRGRLRASRLQHSAQVPCTCVAS